MKKKLIIGLMALSFILTGCGNKEIILNEDGTLDIGDNFKLITTEKENCENKIEEYYSKDGQKVYLVCLDKVELKIGNQKMSLENYFKEYGIDNITNAIVEKLEFEDGLNDGGTLIFKDGKKFKHTNNGIKIIKCKTIDYYTGEYNKDVYIGQSGLDDHWGFDKGGFCGRSLEN